MCPKWSQNDPFVITLKPNESQSIPGLFQNIPNPFKNSTIISYYLPKAAHDATIQIFDLTGKQVKAFTLQGEGFGQVEFNNDINSGTYVYSLIIDGKLIDSKEMVIVK